MKTITLFFMLSVLSNQSKSQLPVQGEYIFSRQEMVAGFHFLPDSTFEFFFSYGAVDRTATGTFAVTGDTLTLKSNKQAGHDFTVKRRSKQDKGYFIKVEDDNKYLLTDIRCTYFIKGEEHRVYTDQKGEIKLDFPNVDQIYIQHDLFPDIVTLVKDEHDQSIDSSLSSIHHLDR